MTTFFWTKYPFVRVGLAFILGIFLAYYFLELPELKINKTYTEITISGIACIVLASAILLFLNQRIHNSLVLILLFIAIGFFRFLVEEPRMNPNHLIHINNNDIHKVIGKINTEPIIKNNKVSYTLSVISIQKNNQWKKHEGHVKVYSSQLQNLQLGQTIIVSGNLMHTQTPDSEYDFNFAEYLAFQKTHHIIYSYKPAAILQSKNFNAFVYLQQKSIESRNYIENIIKSNISKPSNQSIITSLVTGKRSTVSQEDKDLFTNSGTIHILAISGMHIVLIYQVLVFIFTCFRLKVKSAIPSIIIFILIWFYIFICGLQASTVRAGVMLSIVLVANIFQKTPITINSLFAAAFIMLMYNPYYIADIGFCLSFFAVIGICIVSQFTTTEKGLLPYLCNATYISTGAQLTTLPYSIFLFQQFPTYFLLANLIVVPASTLLLLSAIALLAFHQVPYVSTIIIYINNFICDFIFFILQCLNELPFHLITRISITNMEALELYLIIAFISIALFTKKKIYIGALSICACFFACSVNSRIIKSNHTFTNILISGKGDARQYLLVKNNSAYLLKKHNTIKNSYTTEKFLTKNFTQEIKTVLLPMQANFSIEQNHLVAFTIFRHKTNIPPSSSKKTGLNIIDYKNKYSYIKSYKSSTFDCEYTLETRTVHIKQL